MSKIIVRDFNPTSDSGFIYSSFPKGVYHANLNPIKTNKSQWFQAFHANMNENLNKQIISIACMNDSPDTILGYLIINGECLEWIYVKELFRKQGIATLLLKNKKLKTINKDNLTKVGSIIMENHKDLITKKEDENDRPREIKETI